LPRPLSSKVPAWFEWKFDFTFPAEQYPNVCVRLWGTPARLEEILRKVTTDLLVGKPQEKWSAICGCVEPSLSISTDNQHRGDGFSLPGYNSSGNFHPFPAS
jgi:hypothetical protein